MIWNKLYGMQAIYIGANENKMIKIAVCDDDELYINKIIKPLLMKAQKVVSVHTDIKFFTNGVRLLEEYRNFQYYDIVILDIDMPTINGKELAAKLREIDKDLYIAFLSAYKEDVYDVIPLNISAFIPKEYDKEKCLDEFVKLLEKYIVDKPEQKMFGVLENGKSAVIRLCVDKILVIKLTNGIVVITTENGNFISTDRSLRNLETELSPLGFFKICSNILVNVNKVYEVLETEVALNNGSHLPVSRRRRKELLTVLSRIISAKVTT